MKRWSLHLLILFLSVVYLNGCGTAPSNQVTLEVGDNFQTANDMHPEGTVFLVKSGVHKGQQVRNPRQGNKWIGENGAVMDGLETVSEAFTGIAVNVTIQGIEIRNYVDNGIFFRGGNNIILRRLAITDTGSGNGEKHAAIRLNDVENITITDNFFTRVTSGILPSYCLGPVLIRDNQGINVGRNFIQLDKCSGSHIEISYNAMERVGDYLRGEATDVVDWISLFKSNGTEESPILIKNNRARGHGNDRYGSFIMLGDAGGANQIAIGNVGVNPGQVGIGIAGGQNIVVRENTMYSSEWEYSNVAFYSANYSEPHPCENHMVIDNRSFWIKGSIRAQNNIWTDTKCDDVLFVNNYFPDFSLNQDIWYKAAEEFDNRGD
jgi:hypothetical protein